MNPSQEKIEHAKQLERGLRVRIASGGVGQIIAPAHGVNTFGYVPIWLVRLDGAPHDGMYPVWADEIEVLS